MPQMDSTESEYMILQANKTTLRYWVTHTSCRIRPPIIYPKYKLVAFNHHQE